LSPSETSLSNSILKEYLEDEAIAVKRILPLYQPEASSLETTQAYTRRLIHTIQHNHPDSYIENLLSEYGLDSKEGIILMCLAEALLRIPDNATAEYFLRDQLSGADWENHLGLDNTFRVNASTLSLLLTGKVFTAGESASKTKWPGDQIISIVRKLGEPLAFRAIKQAMQIIGQHFVAGQTIRDAIGKSKAGIKKGYCYSYDMLGESALTNNDASRYMDAYATAILAIAGNKSSDNNETVSIKLSALHPRLEISQQRGLKKLAGNLFDLVLLAKQNDVPVTIDAEESWRIEPSLMIFNEIINCPEFQGWGQLGLAVQAYQKRALPVLQWLISLKCPIPVRLVKGAYWDTEIKLAQKSGLKDYPVFTAKANTDLNYLACASILLDKKHLLQPQFGTHNAHTVSSILTLSRERNITDFEFQRLHGMGQALYDYILQNTEHIKCRIYAPVGPFDKLLPYLIRRLLENGANTSFVNLIHRGEPNASLLAEEPAVSCARNPGSRNPKIPLPKGLYGKTRKNSKGFNLESTLEIKNIKAQMDPFLQRQDDDKKIIDDQPETLYSRSPADSSDIIGAIAAPTKNDCLKVLDTSLKAFEKWKNVPVPERAMLLEKAADTLEENYYELMALAIREAGKTVNNAMSEVREAVDFCRYYAEQARKVISEPLILDGPVGEENYMLLEGRGCALCISPWNFPLAIFIGQISAALAAGNTVIAKPSTSTPIIALKAIELFHKAGFPPKVLQILPASASLLESTLLVDCKLGAVLFTGSTAAASRINLLLANNKGPIIPFIAETGGQNAMIADSSALPEQVVKDAVISAFDSAGQRCSALRVLFLQEEMKDHILELMSGYIDELVMGNPVDWETDVGPVIDKKALTALKQHVLRLEQKGRVLYQKRMTNNLKDGFYMAPAIIELQHINELQGEVFGPVLHVISYRSDDIDQVLKEINNTGFGLTLGIHSRISGFVDKIVHGAKVGNVYINRNMIGATVGVQPFGGQRLSGTGPKAGGPHYLLRLATEKAVSINTAAIGGDPRLLIDS